MIILGIHPGQHEASVCLFDNYNMIAAIALERLTRKKIDGGRIPDEAIHECLNIANLEHSDVDAIVLGRGTFPWSYFNHFRGGRLAEGLIRKALRKEKQKNMERELVRYRRFDSESIFNAAQFREDYGFRGKVPIRFFNHHFAHALPTLFHTNWENALLFTADGGGDNVQYSHRIFEEEKLTTIYGGDSELAKPMRIDSLGLAYGFATQALGYQINRHEGKLTGLAALGKPAAYEEIAYHFKVDHTGQISADFKNNSAMQKFIFDVAQNISREDMAASIQVVLENLIIKSVERLSDRYNQTRVGLAGGVFGNVRLNQKLLEKIGLDEIFIYPAMSDQGLPAGGILQFLLERDGLKMWLKNRWELDNLYFGQDFGSDVDKLLTKESRIKRLEGSPSATAAKLIHNGNAVAIYTKGMEYGPRALGARSILAAPTDAKINDTLNSRLGRSEFMPFAPVIAEEDSEEVFEIDGANRYATKFMTITCKVAKNWRNRIPAVVHVDGTARPQIIKRTTNRLYYDILKSYAAISGIPVLINTSFNAHEEPIINRHEECARALLEYRIDAVVTENSVYAIKTT